MRYLAIALPLLLATPARAADERSISCTMVRYALRHYTRDQLEAMARSQGISESTIARLRHCAK